MQVPLKLVRVQTPPRPLIRMVKGGQHLAAPRTWPSRRVVLQPHVHPFIVRLQLDPADVPGCGEPRNRLEQFRILQRRSLLERFYQQDAVSSNAADQVPPPTRGARAGGLTNQPDRL
jgi:hypothetical protein